MGLNSFSWCLILMGSLSIFLATMPTQVLAGNGSPIIVGYNGTGVCKCCVRWSISEPRPEFLSEDEVDPTASAAQQYRQSCVKVFPAVFKPELIGRVSGSTEDPVVLGYGGASYGGACECCIIWNKSEPRPPFVPLVGKGQPYEIMFQNQMGSCIPADPMYTPPPLRTDL